MPRLSALIMETAPPTIRHRIASTTRPHDRAAGRPVDFPHVAGRRTGPAGRQPGTRVTTNVHVRREAT
jgi:hypothetical protein